MESKDIRVQKTIKNIEETFLHLIREKSFSDITIKDICDEAMISRSTFYAHYKDKYDLLEYFFNELTTNFTAVSKNYFCKKSLDLKIETANELLMYVYNNSDIFKTFLELNEENLDLFNKLSTIVYNGCFDYLQSCNRVDKYNLGNAYISQIYTSIIMNSIHWISVHQNKDDITGILKLSADINKYFLVY